MLCGEVSVLSTGSLGIGCAGISALLGRKRDCCFARATLDLRMYFE